MATVFFDRGDAAGEFEGPILGKIKKSIDFEISEESGKTLKIYIE